MNTNAVFTRGATFDCKVNGHYTVAWRDDKPYIFRMVHVDIGSAVLETPFRMIWYDLACSVFAELQNET